MTSEQNYLIGELPITDRKRLLALSEFVAFDSAEVLVDTGEKTRYAFFPTTGFISLVAFIDAQHGVEVGMVGREGLVGTEVALGVAVAPVRAVVQGAGTAWRISARALRDEIKRSHALYSVLHRYIYVHSAQMANGSACIRFHEIEPRLARWLLMTQDRAHSDHFHMTHEFLSYMLGVRREGVTAAAGALHKRGLVNYRRGEVTVLDRVGLEKAACGCYAKGVQIYAQVLDVQPQRKRAKRHEQDG